MIGRHWSITCLMGKDRTGPFDLNAVIALINYFGIDDIIPLLRCGGKLGNKTYQQILKLQQRYQHLILDEIPVRILFQYWSSYLESMYITLDANMKFKQQSPAIKLADWGPRIHFPEVSCEKRFRPNLSLLYEGQRSANIKNAAIDWSTTFWLHNFPWSEFNIGIAGGFVISSLQGILEPDQDIDVYVLDWRQLKAILTYFLNLGPLVTLHVTSDAEGTVSAIKLTSPDHRPLQIITVGTLNMHQIVRTFDLTHLRIWVDRRGLWCDVEAIYELLAGFSRAIGPRCWSEDRLKKYAARGWDIYGELMEFHSTQNDYTDSAWLSYPQPDLDRLVEELNFSYYDYHGYTRYYAGHISHIRNNDVTTYSDEY